LEAYRLAEEENGGGSGVYSIGVGNEGKVAQIFGRKTFFGQTLCNIRAIDIFLEEGRTVFSFYRVMHYSAKRGIAIACRLVLSVCLSVRLSVTLVDHAHRLQNLETNCTTN